MSKLFPAENRVFFEIANITHSFRLNKLNKLFRARISNFCDRLVVGALITPRSITDDVISAIDNQLNE